METRMDRVGSGDLEVEILPELGGRMHRLRAFGQDLLRTPPDLGAYHREPFFWGSFVMAPWCNRMPAGRMRVGAAAVDLPPNFPDGTAIHGEVQALAWDVSAPGVFHVRGGGGGWPWTYEVRQSIEVEGATLGVRLELANRSGEAMPAGIGLHPWFVRPLEVTFNADAVYPKNRASSTDPVPVSGAFDLRRPMEMPPELDATWSALHGPLAAELRWPSFGVAAGLSVSTEGRYLCAASPVSLGAVAVEPQTHAPDGLRRLLDGEPGGLQWLASGATLRLELELGFRRISGHGRYSR